MLLVEAGTHLIFDAMIVPIPYWRTGQSSETVALCGGGHATDVGPRVALICHGAGDIGNLDVSIWDGFRLMSKFVVQETLDDGSYLSWVAPSGKLKRKGCQRIRVRGKRIYD